MPETTNAVINVDAMPPLPLATAEQAAEDQDGAQHEEPANAGFVAQDLWPQIVAVKGLQQNDKDDKIKRLQRVHDQDQQRARNGADVRPEERDNVRHTDDHADQHVIRSMRNARVNETDDADNEGIQQFSA